MALVKTILNGNEVEYDDKEFELKVFERYKNDFGSYNDKYLHYIGNGKNVRNPKGNTSCFRMFEYCNIHTLDLSVFDTAEVVDMSYMFDGCYLKKLDLSSFDTGNVINMSLMFCSCFSLEKVDLSSFNTKNVTDMSYMFYDCIDLKELDVSSFNTSSVTDMAYMFHGCCDLEELDVSNFDVSKVEDVTAIFKGCKSLNIKDSLKQSLMNTKDEKVLYKTFKKLFNIEDSVFINTLYEIRPYSDMLISYKDKVLVPKINDYFGKSLTVNEVREELCKSYTESMVDIIIVSVLNNYYIVKEDFNNFSNDKVKNEIIKYFKMNQGNSNLTVGEVKLKACEDYDLGTVIEAILDLLGNEVLK